jgi:thiol-disulfide isomerase/thioredoxin
VPRAICLIILLIGFLATPAQPQDATPQDILRLLHTHRGKVVVLNFWATWCGPCLKELPEILKLRAMYPEGRLTIIGISMDYDAAALEAFLQRRPLPYLVLRDASGSVAESFGVSQIPRTLIFSPDGQKAADILGETDATNLRRHVAPWVTP